MRGKVLPLLITLAIIGLIAIGGLLLRWHQQRSRVPMLVHAVELDDGALLVRDVDEAWRLLTSEGVLGDVVPLGARARVVAHGGDVLWLAADDVPLRAVRTAGLTPIEPATRAIAGLGPRLEARGRLADGSLVVRTPDRRQLAISRDGQVSAVAEPELVPFAAWDGSRSGQGQQLGVRFVLPMPPPEGGRPYREGEAAEPFRLSDLRLVDPVVVMRWSTGEPLVLRNPDSYLVLHATAAGLGADHLLSRVEAGGRMRWTVSAADLVGPTSMNGASHRVLWVGTRGAQLFALVHAWRTEVASDIRLAQRGEWGEARLVWVDAATGAVARRIEPRRGDTALR